MKLNPNACDKIIDTINNEMPKESIIKIGVYGLEGGNNCLCLQVIPKSLFGLSQYAIIPSNEITDIVAKVCKQFDCELKAYPERNRYFVYGEE